MPAGNKQIKYHRGGVPTVRPPSACRKSLFAPLSQFSELYKVLKTIDFNGAGKQPKRCRWQKKRGCFEEAARFAAQWAQIVMPRRCIPSWVIYAPSAAALRRLRSETRLRAQSRAHPSLPPRKTHHFIDSLREGVPTVRPPCVSIDKKHRRSHLAAPVTTMRF